MTILVLNSGSSTLKFDLGEVNRGGEFLRTAHGAVGRIGGEAEFSAQTGRGATERRRVLAADHHEAVALSLEWLKGSAPAPIDAVGHRVVHGGNRFIKPTRVDDEVLSVIDELSALAPAHNPAALRAIRAAGEILGREVPMVAVFDTAFFHALPAYAAMYALPLEVAERYGIRRYGFHGIAHEYMLRRYSAIRGIPLERATIITLQLGNGCSVAAVKDGRAVDTSMGFTPLEGLVMGTRSGDLDASLVGYLMRTGGMSVEEVDRLLNQQSGLLGVSGMAADMRDLLAAVRSEPRAALAVNLFCYRARKYIGAYLAALGGAQAVVFGGGIGENSPDVRARICDGMSWCGIKLDPAENAAAIGKESRITSDDSACQVYVTPVDEAQLIAGRVARLIHGDVV